MQRAKHPAHRHAHPYVRHANNRGAVFLLSVYLMSLMLLLLSATALQRTTTDLRASQLSSANHQAFWFAEGAMDAGIAQTRSNAASLEDNQPYDVKVPNGSAQFRLQTILNGVQPPTGVVTATPNARTLEVQPARQEVQRYIVATGQVPPQSGATVSAQLVSSSPIDAAWGNGVVVAHGGKAYEDVFVKSNMRSLFSTIATTTEKVIFEYPFQNARGAWDIYRLPPMSTLRYRGLTRVSEQNVDDRRLARQEADACVSKDLLSLRDGYMATNGIARDEDSGVGYVAGAYETNVEHVAGALSIVDADGVSVCPEKSNDQTDAARLPRASLPVAPEFQDCSGVLELSADGPTEIDDGYVGPGGVKDLFPGDGKVTLCVKAIVPKLQEWGWVQMLASGMHPLPDDWLNVPLPEPPEVVFKKPTTIYVTGHQTIDFNRGEHCQDSGGEHLVPMAFPTSLDAASPIFHPRGQQLDFPPCVADPLMPSVRFDAQTGQAWIRLAPELAKKNVYQLIWNVSVSAKMSVVDDSGQVIPQGIQIIQAVSSSADAGIIMIKPKQFSGSVYAPDSLVVIRERAPEDRPVPPKPLELHGIIGNEVVVELFEDSVNFGAQTTDRSVAPSATANVFSWTSTQGRITSQQAEDAAIASNTNVTAKNVAANFLTSQAIPNHFATLIKQQIREIKDLMTQQRNAIHEAGNNPQDLKAMKVKQKQELQDLRTYQRYDRQRVQRLNGASPDGPPVIRLDRDRTTILGEIDE